ncbi:MAG: PQQ-binding-like beta-propeller repeat protein, partial [Oligoflexia bacterium]|nr:PQQ-binding-like beta-propeller repeat protein [Oligoflexia bacterium]
RTTDGDASTFPWQYRRRVVDGRGVIRQPEIRWRLTLGGPITTPLTVGKTGIWAVAGGKLNLVDGRGRLQLSKALAATTAVSLSPDGPVFGSADGALLAVSASTGEITLAWAGSGRARGGAVPLDSGLVWASSDGVVRHTVTGQMATLLTVTAQPASDGQRAYFQTQSGVLVAMDTTGTVWRAPIAGPGAGAPLVGDGLVYAAWDSFRGQPGGVMAVLPETGRQVWSVTLDAPPSASMAFPSGSLLVPLSDGTLLCLDPTTGSQRWATRLGPDPLTTPPLVAGHSAWVGDSGGRLHRVDLDDGGEAWSLQVGAPISSGPELAWDLILVGLSSGELVAIGSHP